MRQTTLPEQTAKLIELGLLPKHIQSVSDDGKMLLELMGFSIGELIEMLPKVIDCNYDVYNLQIEAKSNWKVCYVENGMIEDDCDSSELIDALYNMIIKLKKAKVL